MTTRLDVQAVTGNAMVDEALRRLRTEGDAFCAHLASLSLVDWDRPTNCPGWTIRLLVAHVVRGGESFLRSLERGLAGNLEPALTPEQKTARMHEIAAHPPAKILAELRTINDRFERAFGALRPDQLGTLGEHPFGPRSARWFAQQRLAEVAFHRWDLAASLGARAELDSATAGFLLPMLVEENLPVMMGHDWPRARASFHFGIAGSDRSWTAAASPGRLAITRGSTAPADVQVDGDAAALALLVYGRRTLAELRAEGRVSVKGDRAAVERFSEVFHGP